MTPGARISAAIDILDQVFDGMAAEQALTRWARRARYAGSKDRAAVRDHVFQVLRCRRSYAAFGGGQDGRSAMMGALRAADSDPADFFTGEGHAPAALTVSETEDGRLDLTDAEAADLPDWLWSVFREDLGDNAAPMAAAQKQRAPIALRVNSKVGDVSRAMQMLSEEGIVTQPVADCDTALIVEDGDRKIRQSAAYNEGVVELQDVSSQSAMRRVSVPRGARVLDYCAGGGGKTLALAAATPPGAKVQFFAHDADPRRMADLPSRAKRAGVKIECLRTGGLAAHGPFDVVVCDVPCSGSGTWRRTPEAKWKLTPIVLREIIKKQNDILAYSCDLVAPGGCLVYTTCTVLKRENEDQIEQFCRSRSDFWVSDQVRWPVSDTGDGFFLTTLMRAT